MLENGETFILDADPTPGDADRVHLPHPEILAALEPGHALLLDDGKMRLTSIDAKPKAAPSRGSWSAAACRTARASACPTRKSRSRP